MNATTAEILLARTISLRGVHPYLHANGWVRDDSSRRESSDIHLRLEDDREAAIIQAFEDSADCGTLICQVAEQVARVERKRRQAVLTDLAPAESDVVRLPNAHADNPLSARLQAWRCLRQPGISCRRRPARRIGRNETSRPAGTWTVCVLATPGRAATCSTSCFRRLLLLPRRATCFLSEIPVGEESPRLSSGRQASREAVDRFNRGPRTSVSSRVGRATHRDRGGSRRLRRLQRLPPTSLEVLPSIRPLLRSPPACHRRSLSQRGPQVECALPHNKRNAIEHRLFSSISSN